MPRILTVTLACSSSDTTRIRWTLSRSSSSSQTSIVHLDKTNSLNLRRCCTGSNKKKRWIESAIWKSNFDYVVRWERRKIERIIMVFSMEYYPFFGMKNVHTIPSVENFKRNGSFKIALLFTECCNWNCTYRFRQKFQFYVLLLLTIPLGLYHTWKET